MRPFCMTSTVRIYRFSYQAGASANQMAQPLLRTHTLGQHSNQTVPIHSTTFLPNEAILYRE